MCTCMHVHVHNTHRDIQHTYIHTLANTHTYPYHLFKPTGVGQVLLKNHMRSSFALYKSANTGLS